MVLTKHISHLKEQWTLNLNNISSDYGSRMANGWYLGGWFCGSHSIYLPWSDSDNYETTELFVPL